MVQMSVGSISLVRLKQSVVVFVVSVVSTDGEVVCMGVVVSMGIVVVVETVGFVLATIDVVRVILESSNA